MRGRSFKLTEVGSETCHARQRTIYEIAVAFDRTITCHEGALPMTGSRFDTSTLLFRIVSLPLVAVFLKWFSKLFLEFNPIFGIRGFLFCLKNVR